jgi:Putative prokaryotic signal transducing protein
MKIIYKARDIIEAHIVSGMLNANGIETHVGGYYLQGGVGDVAVYDFANVQVADEDVALAAPLVADYDGVQDDISEQENVNFGDKGYIAG